MPTPNKKLTPPPRPLWRRKKFWLIVLPLLLIISGITAEAIQRDKNLRAIEADRARFVQADKDVQAIAAEIVKATSPEKSEIVKECTTQSRKSGTEPLICGITFKALYGVESLDQANRITQIVTNTLDAEPGRFNLTRLSNENSATLNTMINSVPNEGKVESAGAVYKSSKNNMNCPLSFELFRSNTPPYYVENASGNSYSVTLMIFCNDYAKAQHYKLKD